MTRPLGKNGDDWREHTLERGIHCIFDQYQVHCRSLLPCTVVINHETNSSQNLAAAQVIVELDENDIPGAVLNTKSIRFQP